MQDGQRIEVMAQASTTEGAAAGVGELHLDLVAAGFARLAALDQARSRSEHEPLHLGLVAVEDFRHLLVGERLELGEHERGPLILGKLAHVREQLAQLRSAFHVLVEPGGRDLHLADLTLTAGAQHGQAAVARDGIEPGPEVDDPVVGLEVTMGRGEHLLHRVLGLLARAEHVPAERQDAGQVALVEHLEGVDVARPHPRDELGVGAQGEHALGGAYPRTRGNG